MNTVKPLNSKVIHNNPNPGCSKCETAMCATCPKNAIKDVAKGIAKDAEDYVSTHRPMTNVERAIYALAWVSAAKDWPYTPDKPFPPSDVALLMAADKATIAVLRFREAGEHITDTNGWDSEMWKFYADAAGVDEREHPPIHTSCGG